MSCLVSVSRTLDACSRNGSPPTQQSACLVCCLQPLSLSRTNVPPVSRLVALPRAQRAGSTSLLVLSRPGNDGKPSGVLDRTPQGNQVPQRCLSLSGSTGMSRQTLTWDSFASFGSLSCTSSPANSLWFPPNLSISRRHPVLDYQLPHEISTRRSTWPKSALKTLTPCYHVLAKNKK